MADIKFEYKGTFRKGKMSKAAKQAFKNMLNDDITLLRINIISDWVLAKEDTKIHCVLTKEKVCLVDEDLW